ncbi:MAG: alpha/beta hydrolase [Bacteroidales bacterium]
MPYLKTREATIYYDVRGEGPWLAMIAGLGSDHQSWQFILKDIQKHFRVLIWDNRGSGRTKAKSASFGMADLSRDCIALLDEMNIEKCFLIGHSMGGGVSQLLALHHPLRIQKMILASATTHMSDRNKSLFDFLITSWKDGLSQEQWLRNLFYWLFSPKAFSNPRFLDAAIISTVCYPYTQSPENFKAQIDALVSFDSGDLIKDIHTPTKLISGSRDILVYPDETEKLKEMPGVEEMAIIPGAGHSIHAEYPGEFVREVLDYFL